MESVTLSHVTLDKAAHGGRDLEDSQVPLGPQTL